MRNPNNRACPECGTKNRPYEVKTCRKCGYVFLWRRSFGRKGYNRVTVYERTRGGEIQIMWWDRRGPHRETLRNLKGVPIYSHERAERIAQRVSEDQAKKRRELTRLGEALGLPERRTVGELFAQIFRDRATEWSDKWTSDQRRYRRFWENELGRDTGLTEVTPALVSRIVARAARDRGWQEKTQNHYLNAAVEAWSYAEKQLKWIGPQNNLETVRRHRVHVDNMDLAYEGDEARAILEHLPSVDLRAAVVGELSYVAGRRLNAIMHLQVKDYRTESRIVTSATGTVSAEFGVVTFPAVTDKARKRGEVYLYGRSKDLVEELLSKPLVRSSGLLIPRGDDLEAVIAVRVPQTDKKLRRALQEAERRAGVPHVKGRSFHAFNRAFSTDTDNTRAASGQSGKTEETIRRIYRQPKPDEKAALAIEFDSLRRGA